VPDSMTVRLHLYRIRVIEVLIDLPERLEVVVRYLRSVVRCPFCGFSKDEDEEYRSGQREVLAHHLQRTAGIERMYREDDGDPLPSMPRRPPRSPRRCPWRPWRCRCWRWPGRARR